MESAPTKATAVAADTLAKAQRGDRQALETVLAQVAPSVHRFARRMCRNESDADDVLQDTLVSVATNLPTFQERSSLTSWVFTLARTACSRRHRGLESKALREAAGDEVLGSRADDAKTPEAQVADEELSAALGRALAALPADHREVIHLRDIEGLSAPEAASALGISVDALKSRLHRAREALRNTLRPLLEPVHTQVAGGCPDIIAMWSQKLDGDLSAQDCSAMEKHIATCAECNSACGALKRALLVCQQTRNETVPAEVQARVKAAVRAWAANTLV
jgi:RNA polymerase sigma-70 factor (ECF subfamily)